MINHLINSSKDSDSFSGVNIQLIKKYSSKIPLNEVFKVTSISIVLINSGHLHLQLNNSIQYLNKNDLIVVPKNTQCKIIDLDTSFHLTLMSFTTEFALQNTLKMSRMEYFDFLITKTPPKITLTTEDYLHLTDLFKLLDSKIRGSESNIFQKGLLLFSFNMLMLELGNIYNKYSKDISLWHTRKEKLLLQFFKTLEANCRKQHSVKFYAEALCITSGHLNKIIKELTNRTAKQFIEEAIIMEAKTMLHNDKFTIGHITDELEFSNSSFFSNFFKRHTTQSPSEFRQYGN